jgi:hypothetical protein
MGMVFLSRWIMERLDLDIDAIEAMAKCRGDLVSQRAAWLTTS